MSQQKFLTPDIKATYQKQKNSEKKLAKPNISCGIFQDGLDVGNNGLQKNKRNYYKN